MIRCKKNNIEWLEFEQLQEFPEVVHGVFLRHGGVSTGPYASLNIGKNTEDHLEALEENRKRISLLFDLPNLFAFRRIPGEELQSIFSEREIREKGCEGLITTQSHVGLLMTHADCQAAIFFDPIKKVVANVHCGWRGNVQNIYKKAIEKIQREFGSHVEDLRVCISPSLGPEKAEFIYYKEELPNGFLPFRIKENHFDFWEISKMQLIEAGILDKHIEIAKLCTYTEKKDFFSYRREKKTGRNATVVALKPSERVSKRK